MKMQETLATEAAAPGMRLAEAVIDESGRVLVPAGGELSETILRSLIRREIAAVTIEREIEEDPVAREARWNKLSQQLDQIFRKAGDGTETRLLYQSILEFQMEAPR